MTQNFKNHRMSPNSYTSRKKSGELASMYLQQMVSLKLAQGVHNIYAGYVEHYKCQANAVLAYHDQSTRIWKSTHGVQPSHHQAQALQILSRNGGHILQQFILALILFALHHLLGWHHAHVTAGISHQASQMARKKTLNEIDFYKIQHQDRFYEAGSLSVCNVLIYKAFAYIKLYMQALNINPFELLQ